MSTARITLDNPAFSGRFRDLGRGSHYVNASPKKRLKSTVVSDIRERQVRVAPAQAARPAKVRQNKSQVLQRRVAKKPSAKRKTNRSIFDAQKLMLAMASAVFLLGVGAAIQGFSTNKKVVAQVQAVTQQKQGVDNQQSNGALPDETEPTEQTMGEYVVEASHPRYIRIPKIGVFSRVTAQGLDAQGAVKAPNNVYDTGWYNASAKPGEQGAMLLDSHVSGPTVRGAFFNIKNLAAGDLIEIEKGDGQKINYSVVSSAVTKATDTDMAAAMAPANGSDKGVNLITCAGKFDPATGAYEDRIVVYAVQI